MYLDNDQHPGEMEANSGKTDKGESPKIPSVSMEEDSVPVYPESVSDQNQGEKIATLEDRLERIERRESRLTAVIAFAAVVSACVAYLQWDTMKGQLEEMRGNGQQTDRLIAQITEQTSAANQLAKIARESLDESRRQFQQDRRPYVNMHVTPMQFEPNKEMLINVYSGNSGKSIAVKVGGRGHIFLGNDALEQAYSWFDGEAKAVFDNRTETVIPPGITPSHPDAIRSTLRSGRIIGIKEFESLTARNYSIVVAFRQAYLDTAGNTYWADICVTYLASNAIAFCPRHNRGE